MHKIYMAGVGGMLGKAFYEQFKEDYEIKCTDIDVNENWLSYLDFRNNQDYKSAVLKFNPDYLFHIGAYTNLEFCEKNPEDTNITNTTSVKYAASIANDLNIPYLDKLNYACNKKMKKCETVLPNGEIIYFDYSHTTMAGAKYLGKKIAETNWLDF